MFNGLTREVVVGFVDIDEIVNHHCLNFLCTHLYNNKGVADFKPWHTTTT
jgi:hypothetical protein